MPNTRLNVIGVLVLCLTFPHSGLARMVTSFGNSSCEEWTKAGEQARSNVRFSNIRSLGMNSWLMGYVSALNSSSSSAADLLDNVDSSTIRDWVDKYCLENSTESVSDAAQNLIKKLEKLARRKK